MDSEMEQGGSAREQENALMQRVFAGRVVRKALTKQIKEGWNVPVYVLEFLLGEYCNTQDEEGVQAGVAKVKEILSQNFVRPDEAPRIISLLRERGRYSVIDKVGVKLNVRKDVYEASFMNLGLAGIPVPDEYPRRYDRLLCGGIWCMVQLSYEFHEEDKKGSPITVVRLQPIQMPSLELAEVQEGRRHFSKEQWMNVMLRSTGLEPERLSERAKWLLLLRMVPLVENNFNLCELGPRSTGKSHLYKEVCPYSVLVSGGQTTVANLFYNMGTHAVGLVGLWDCVAFDEVAGIRFKDADGIQIMKDYMASGSFTRGKDAIAADASMVFVGNIDQSVESLLKTSTLFEPFPEQMGTDTAFLDRMHCYLPGWEVPKFHPAHFTDDVGFITDYLAGFMRELRKTVQSDAVNKWFELGSCLNQRDTIAVRRMCSGLLKLLYPHGEFGKEEVEEVLRLALEMRRRVKEQLKKLGGMEFYDVNFCYVDLETQQKTYVGVPEQSAGKLIPDGLVSPGQVYTVAEGKSSGLLAVYRLESQMMPGSGKLTLTGLNRDAEGREQAHTAYNYLKVNARRISRSISTTARDYMINYIDLQGIGMTSSLSLPTLISLCSIALEKPVQPAMAVLGSFSIAGTIVRMENLASALQVALDSGARRVLLPAGSFADFGSVPPELLSHFQLIPYTTPEDAVCKALTID